MIIAALILLDCFSHETAQVRRNYGKRRSGGRIIGVNVKTIIIYRYSINARIVAQPKHPHGLPGENGCANCKKNHGENVAWERVEKETKHRTCASPEYQCRQAGTRELAALCGELRFIENLTIAHRNTFLMIKTQPRR